MKGKHLVVRKKTKKIIVLIRIILIIVIIYASVEITKWFLDNKKNDDIMNEITEFSTQNSGDGNNEINFEKLREINSDTIAWLKVNNTNVNSPVVKTTDNDYYLTHNFKKETNRAGWIFMDYRNQLDGSDKNIIIYGHNMRNGAMFGSLLNTLTEKWQENEENRHITLTINNEVNNYLIFSVYQIEDENYYIKTSFEENKFGNFVNKLKERSKKNFGVDVNENDKILTLSTCGNDSKYRVVIHAKKI